MQGAPSGVPTSTLLVTLVVIGVVAANVGIFSPIVMHWISSRSGDAQGAKLGQQTAAASLGSAVGAVLAGFLFTVTVVPGASFIVVDLHAAAGIGLSLRMPSVFPRPRGAFGHHSPTIASRR